MGEYDRSLLEKINNSLDELKIEMKEISMELDEHKERHKMVMDIFFSIGKLLVGITTVLGLIGGAGFTAYKLIKGGQ